MFLQWENLVCGFSGRPPLNASFSGSFCEPGIYAVLGPNGCGKSTLMRTWLGLHAPISGRTLTLGKSKVKSGFVGYVPQSHRLNPYFPISVSDVVAQGFGPCRKLSSLQQSRLAQVLDIWGISKDSSRSFHELSLGSKTRTLVARAIVNSPKLLFLDEPLASLDIHCQKMLIETLHSLAKNDGVCSVVIDHHFENFESFLSGSVSFTRGQDPNVCSGFGTTADVCSMSVLIKPVEK